MVISSLKTQVRFGRIAFVAAVLNAACVTGPKAHGPLGQTHHDMKEKAGKKSPPGAEGGAEVESTPLHLWGRLVDPEQAFTTREWDAALALGVLSPGGVEEAVVAAASVRQFLVKPEQQGGSSTAADPFAVTARVPIGAEPNPVGAKATQALSLESVLAHQGINLAESIGRNPLLKTASFLKLVQRALDQSEDSPAFVESVRIAIAEQAKDWNQLNGNAEVRDAGSEDEGETVPEGEPTEPAGPITFEVAPPRQGEQMLQEAQHLADRGSFKEAIERAHAISEDDPVHLQARDKIKRFSNKAVQVLRQKAAQAYESAMPVTDPTAKAAYLEHAQKYLNEALADYPQADQVLAVKENLAVISSTLETLRTRREEADRRQETER